MLRIKYGDTDVELIPDDDWTTTETTNAERALGVDYFEGTTAERLKVAIFISIKRLEPETPEVVIADAVGEMRLGPLAKQLQETKDQDPPRAEEAAEANGLPTSGLPPWDRSALPSRSGT